MPTDTSGIPILEGPAIQHVPPEGPFVEDVAIAFEATASDVDGVDAVDLYYRTSGELPYRAAPRLWSPRSERPARPTRSGSCSRT